jgi:lipopolysaccharide assembly outer membrane protein LptD (OstA)
MLFCKSLYINPKHFILVVLIGVVLPCTLHGQNRPLPTDTTKNARLTTDSISKTAADSVKLKATDKKKSDKIDAEINYTANDSIVFLGNGVGILYGQSDITYKKINLKADYVRISMDSSLVYARGVPDSLGVATGDPVFSEGDKSYNSKAMTYNLQTKKGYIRQAVTQEGEGYIISDKTKKSNDDEFCISGGKYTTCDNHDHPDFYLSMSKGKVKPGSYVVSGPAHLVVADVPLPIFVPFGFFPFTSDYSSGILMPSYTDELTRGFGLQNGGYYFAINEYVDLELRGDFYTKGTWAVRGTSTYTKRYKYRGNFGFEYREDVTGEKGFADYTKNKTFKLSWSHSQDAKANPNFTFSSSVNFATSGYQRNNINYYSRADLNSENTKYSSINFTKRFSSLPSLSLSGGMSATQKTSDSTVNLSLPSLSISYSRFYPFKRKNVIGKERWYEKISMSYSGALSNSITTKENLLLKSNLQRDWKNGMKHSIPVSATFNLLKFINITPSFNYTERWYLQSYNKSWDKENQVELTDTVYKFNRVYDFNMGVSASTKLYGMYQPLFSKKILAIRHVFTPTISFGYTPNFGDAKWGYYDSYIKSVQDTKNPEIYHDSEVRYSHYAGSLYGSPGDNSRAGSIGFSLNNNLEMKVRNNKDTTNSEATKIISLIDQFSINGSYNMVADSMNWSNFSTSLRIKLTKSYSLSLSAAFDPYMYGLNSSGSPVRINKLRWENGQLPRFLGTSTSYSYTLSNDTFKKLFGKKTTKKDGDGGSEQQGAEGENPEGGETNSTGGHDHKDEKKADIDSDGYEKVTIPWSISINYNISYQNKDFNKEKMEYNMGFTQYLSFSGNISLTNNWKISSSTSYDFTNKKFTQASVNVSRSLHCWSMSASFVPFGIYKSYSFHIGVNSSMLADLKYDKQSAYGTTNINWY